MSKVFLQRQCSSCFPFLIGIKLPRYLLDPMLRVLSHPRLQLATMTSHTTIYMAVLNLTLALCCTPPMKGQA